jgi:uncharacterized protein YcbK (DUF882 family)
MGAKGQYFKADELRCKCGCGKNGMKQETVDKLDRLRQALGRPIFINSAYRCPEHNKKIGATQTHATGQAVDIRCSYIDAFEIVGLAEIYGFTGIGVKQKGHVTGRFIHLDDLEDETGRPRPHIWSY